MRDITIEELYLLFTDVALVGFDAGVGLLVTLEFVEVVEALAAELALKGSELGVNPQMALQLGPRLEPLTAKHMLKQVNTKTRLDVGQYIHVPMTKLVFLKISYFCKLYMLMTSSNKRLKGKNTYANHQNK